MEDVGIVHGDNEAVAFSAAGTLWLKVLPLSGSAIIKSLEKVIEKVKIAAHKFKQTLKT